jgi:hypothetical protein
MIFAKRLLRVVERERSLAGNLHNWPDAWRSIAERAGVSYGRDIVMA